MQDWGKFKTSGRDRRRHEDQADDTTSFPVPDSISAKSRSEICAF